MRAEPAAAPLINLTSAPRFDVAAGIAAARVPRFDAVIGIVATLRLVAAPLSPSHHAATNRRAAPIRVGLRSLGKEKQGREVRWGTKMERRPTETQARMYHQLVQGRGCWVRRDNKERTRGEQGGRGDRAENGKVRTRRDEQANAAESGAVE